MAIELGAGYISTFPKLDAGKTRAAANDLENQLEKSGDDAGRRAGDGFAGTFGAGIKKAVGLAVAAFAGLQVVGQLKDATLAASNLAETVSFAGQVFGQEALPELEAWAKGAARAFGQSRTQALEAASTFAVFGKSAGLAGQDLTGFSKTMAELASDFASARDTTPAEAIEAIGAALRGESEPIRKYGILLDDATLKQRALALGLIDTTKNALTPQQRVLAAQAEILAQSTDMQGNFAQTSGGLANQLRQLNSVLANGKIALGEALLPAATAVVSFLVSTGIPAFQNFTGAVRDAFSQIAESVTGAAGFGETIAVEIGKAFGLEEDDSRVTALAEAFRFIQDTAAEAFFAVRDAAAAAAPVIADVFDFVVAHKDAFVVAAAGVAGFTAALVALGQVNAAVSAVSALGSSTTLLGRALPLLATPAGLAVAVIAALAVAAFVAYKKFEPFREVVDTVARTIRDVAVAAFERLKEVVEDVSPVFRSVFSAVKDAVITAKDALVGFAGDVRASLEPLVAWFQEHVGPTLAAGWDLLLAVLGRVGQQLNNLRTIFETVLNALAPIVAPALGFIRDGFLTFIGVVQPLWEGFWNIIGTVAGAAFDVVRVVVETVLGVIRGIFEAVTGIINGDWEKFWEGIKTIAESLFNGAKEILSTILETIKTIFSEAFEAVKTTVTNALDAVVGFLEGVGSRATTALGDLLGTLVQKGRDLIQGLRNGVEEVVGQLEGYLGGLGSKVVGAVGAAGEWLYWVGRDVIRGMIDGVESMAQAVKDAVVDVVTAPIDAAKWALGIDSPSKVFMEIGVWSGEGLALGLDKSQRMVEVAARDLTVGMVTQTVAPSVVAPNPASAPVAVGPRTVEVALNLNGREIQRELVRLERAAR